MFFYLSKIFTFLIDPLPVFILILLVFLIRRRKRLIPITLLILFSIISTPFTAYHYLHFLEHLEKPSRLNPTYDAVVVLSGMVHLDLSSEDSIEFSSAVDRILSGIEIVREGMAEKMIISGGDGSLSQPGKSESVLLRQFVQRFGLTEDQVIIDPESRNTYENALFTKKIAEEYGTESLLLITSAFHIFRAKGCFAEVGLDPDILPVDYEATLKGKDFRVYLPSAWGLYHTNIAVHETVGILVYGLTGKASYF